ncbi:hypothetical protein Tco_1343599 [Tanacetum coccineum]
MALQITPVDNKLGYLLLPTSGLPLVEFVNKLRYPKEVMHLSNVTTNDHGSTVDGKLAPIINLCLGKNSGFERREPSAYKSFGVLSIELTFDYAD